jgi:hypothetical protein
MNQPSLYRALLVAAAIPMLLAPIHLLQAEPTATQSVDVPVAEFMGPAPGTTYVYHFFRNGALVEGQKRLVKGVSREGASRIRLHTVARLAEGPTLVPIEGSSEDVLQSADASLELIDSEGRVFVLLSGPLKTGRTWARATMEGRPTSRGVRESAGRGGTELDGRTATWTPLVGTCRIERLYKAAVFGKERTVVVLSTSVTLTDGITETNTEEWASGVGLVRAVKNVRDRGRRDLELIEQRLVRILRTS